MGTHIEICVKGDISSMKNFIEDIRFDPNNKDYSRINGNIRTCSSNEYVKSLPDLLRVEGGMGNDDNKQIRYITQNGQCKYIKNKDICTLFSICLKDSDKGKWSSGEKTELKDSITKMIKSVYNLDTCHLNSYKTNQNPILDWDMMSALYNSA